MNPLYFFESDLYNYRIEYKFDSPLERLEGYNYLSYYKAVINIYNADEIKIAELGKLRFHIVHIGIAIEHGFSLNEINSINFSFTQSAPNIFDLTTEKYNSEFLKLQTNEILNQDLLIIDGLFVSPEFRGYDIGRKILLKLYHNFKNTCGIIVCKVCPIQYSEKKDCSFTANEYNTMKSDSFIDDKETAFYKIKNIFTKAGFKFTIGINEDVAYINTREKITSKADEFFLSNKQAIN